MKTCCRCEMEKPLNAFNKRKAAKDGLCGYCKECNKKDYIKYKEEKPLKLKQYRKKAFKKFYKQNPGYYDYVNKSYNRQEITNKWKYSWGSGVYGIFSKGKALYIGESTQLRKRITEHISYIKNPQSNKSYQQEMYWEILKEEDFVVGIIEQCDNHKEREQYYINQLKPLYNA